MVPGGSFIYGGMIATNREGGRNRKPRTHILAWEYKAEKGKRKGWDSTPPGTYVLPASVPLLNFPDSITS